MFSFYCTLTPPPHILACAHHICLPGTLPECIWGPLPLGMLPYHSSCVWKGKDEPVPWVLRDDRESHDCPPPTIVHTPTEEYQQLVPHARTNGRVSKTPHARTHARAYAHSHAPPPPAARTHARIHTLAHYTKGYMSVHSCNRTRFDCCWTMLSTVLPQ
jgi:hypothetical protein